MGWLAVDGWLAAWSGPSNPTLWAERRTATTATTATSATTTRAAGHRRASSGSIVSSIWSGGAGSTKGGPASGPGLGGLSERLQAGVFAVYGTDNTWLFAARNEREKLDWIFRIDQSYFTGTTTSSAVGSGAVSPMPGAGNGLPPFAED